MQIISPNLLTNCFKLIPRLGVSLGLMFLPTSFFGSMAKAAPVELLVNGSFETGGFTGWTNSVVPDRPFRPWAVSHLGGGGYEMDPVSPQDGTYAAWNGFDGVGPLEFLLKQRISLPVNQTITLSWKHRIQWNFTLGTTATEPRQLIVELLSPASGLVVTQLYSFSTGTQVEHPMGDTGWTSLSADLSAFAGSDVDLQFREVIPQMSTGPGQIEFDAVSVMSELRDRDGDGIPDASDHCPDSDLRPSVFVEDCDSGVPNVLFEDGCTIADLVQECASMVRNHGEFVSKVAWLLNELKNNNIITTADKGAIQSCAAQSTIGQYPRPNAP